MGIRRQKFECVKLETLILIKKKIKILLSSSSLENWVFWGRHLFTECFLFLHGQAHTSSLFNMYRPQKSLFLSKASPTGIQTIEFYSSIFYKFSSCVTLLHCIKNMSIQIQNAFPQLTFLKTTFLWKQKCISFFK